MIQTLIQTARDCWKDAVHGGVGLGAITMSLKVETITVWLQIASLCGGILLCLLSLVSVALTIERKWRQRNTDPGNTDTHGLTRTNTGVASAGVLDRTGQRTNEEE
jgi:hypothetical protein